jgi:hypothetical protein
VCSAKLRNLFWHKKRTISNDCNRMTVLSRPVGVVLMYKQLNRSSATAYIPEFAISLLSISACEFRRKQRTLIRHHLL